MVGLKANINVSNEHIITTEDFIKEVTEGLGPILFQHMKKHQANIAQIDAVSGRKDTFQELLQRCVRTALHLSSKNITANHIITLCTNNHSNSVVPFIAAQFVGAKIASVDPSFSLKEMSHLLSLVRPKILFVVPESVPIIEKVLEDISLNSEIVVFGSTSKHTKFSDFLQTHPDEENFQPAEIKDINDTAVIYFSSGTTGLPKGVCLSHYSIMTQIYSTNHTENPDYEYMKSQATRVSLPLIYLYYTSLYWVSAGTFLITSIINGICRLVCPKFDGKEVWNLLHKYKPVCLALTPVCAIEMLVEGCPENIDLRSLLSVIIMGSAIPKEYCLRLQQIFPESDVVQGYGLTEVSGPLTMFRGNDKFHRPLLKSKIESVGLPVRGVTYKVVDPVTNEALGPNKQGELRIKSKLIMNGYYNMDSSETFDEDGWLKTGDIVCYDADYCFYVIDRIKEAFKYQGWFIAPTMLENVLLNHPAVKQAVVIGIPKDDGHHPMGVVVLRENVRVTEEEIEKFVEERVSERQRLRAGVKFAKTIPLTVTGKVKRVEVRKMVLEGLI